MINTPDFSKRLHEIMDYYDETASSFAEKIGVQRSSISHILSGRNKPSLDFVMKVLNTYPEVDLYWLLNGKGNFPSKSSTPIKLDSKMDSLSSEMKKETSDAKKHIERIVVFYSDGTFKNYTS